ncbi:hypothetical protein BDP27DRAFT_1318062 [Rhodocollybia butyracea]|uniref:Uncharacterized protein n=1 Tax=Rhodocollybia butyracea TaxID=206335 RepID=A0A9P5Q1G2_9AGAR|nr:hypothetical protein BDP27DRAFT_1318062 [Rhodocollybia butyracea]
MIFDQANAPHLKPWLVRTLEPICDAEPGALADYILALLKHNVPELEMKKELQSQLEEFLEKECTPFIDTLFTALRSKSYLPYEASPTVSGKPDPGIPIPLDALLSSPSISSSPEGSRKRSLENPEPGSRPPAKGPRLEGQFSRHSNGRGAPDSRTGGWSNKGGRPNGMGPMNGQPAYQPPDQKKICRDYYNLGFCSRGALCKFSHGEDALIPDQLYMNGGPMLMPMFNGIGMGAGPTAAYDPREARMDMRLLGNGRNAQARPAVLPRMQQEEGSSKVVHSSNVSGELPVIQDLTPEVPLNAVTPNPATHSAHSSSTSSVIPSPNPTSLQGPSYIPNALSTPSSFMQDTDMEMAPPGLPPMGAWRGRVTGRGAGRAMGRGRQPGAFNGDHASFSPEKRKDKTLVLEKIPEDKLSLSQVNDWFTRFGTVTNVAIDQGQKKALISFSTHEEAHAAWKSEDAVFNNRFVKVFWHRPMEGHGEAGRRALAASAPVLAKASTNEASLSSSETTSTSAPPRKASVSSTATALAAKQQLLEQQIAEQKSLMASLSTASSPEEKKQIMDRFKQLDGEMKAASSTSPVPPKAPTVDDKLQKERERLDKELDLRSSDADASPEGAETTEDLQVKLARLKAEAASLGISDDPHTPSYSAAPYRGYRGRGRGSRGTYFRGGPRGGPPRTHMSLDNRPKKLLVKGASSETEQALRDWYETTGQMESVTQTDSGDMIVSFRTRPAAEQGLAKGTSIPMIGSVQVSWFTGAQPSLSASKTDSQVVDSTFKASLKVDSIDPESSTHSVEEVEDVVASGWGREDDGMGM